MRHAPAVEDITGDVIDPRQSAAMESIHLCSFVKIRSCFREREREREREKEREIGGRGKENKTEEKKEK